MLQASHLSHGKMVRLRIRVISVEETQRARDPEIRDMPVIHNRDEIVQAATWMYAGMEKQAS